MTNLADRVKILHELKTKELIEAITSAESDYETAMRAENAFRDQNSGYLSSGVNDCQEVKIKLAELGAGAPKMTVAQRDDWLLKQRKEDVDLAQAIHTQQSVAFNLENHKITIEMARRKLERMRAVLELRRAQISFLGSSG